MAYMGRGETPSIGQDNNNEYPGGVDWHYRRDYYIAVDNTYIMMQIIATFIILIIGAIAFIVTYQSTIIDPIESMKKLFINTHLIAIGILLAITLIINFFSKTETALMKRLVTIAIISIITMLTFFVIKLSLDATYTQDKFEEFYTEQNVVDTSNDKTRIDIGVLGISLKTEKEYYINECMKLYDIFKIKTYSILVMHLLLNILLIYQISRVSKIEEKKDQVNKDDLILFDEEQNIKY